MRPPVLQFNDLRADQRKEPWIRINTRELNRELCTRLSTLYTKSLWSMLLLLEPTLNDHVFALRSIYVIYVV